MGEKTYTISYINPEIIDALEAGEFTGAVRGLSNYEYHGFWRYWSSTQLKYMANECPLKFKAKYVDRLPGLQDESESSHYILGSLVHCLALAPDDFSREFFILPDLNYRTAIGRQERDVMRAEHRDKIFVSQDHIEKARLILNSLINLDSFSEIKDADREVSLFWKCPFSGLNFRAKLDAYKPGFLYELKTTSCGEPEIFSKQCDSLNYDLSVAHYLEGVRQVFGHDGVSVNFFVAETEEPFVAEKYPAHELFTEVGHQKWLESVSKLENGVMRNYWPSYLDEVTRDISFIMPTPWTMKRYLNSKGATDAVYHS